MKAKPRTKKEAAKPATVVAYKGFMPGFICRDYRYEIGKTHHHEGEIKPCSNGFHACEYPLSVFEYYPPAGSVFAEVELSGKIKKEADKSVSSIIAVKGEVSIKGLVDASIEFIRKNLVKDDNPLAHNTGDYSAASNTGNRSAASNTGNRSAASNTGDYSAASNTGNRSAASNTGDYSAASNTGDYSAASNTGFRSAASNTGDYSAASNTGFQSAASNTGFRSAASNTGDYSAASNTGFRSAASNTGFRSAASNTGDYSAASNTGNRSAASNTGDYSAASNTGNRSAASNTGQNGVAAAFGLESKAMAGDKGILIVAWWDGKADRKRVTVGHVGENGIEPNVWYQADAAGKLIPVKEAA
jgi:hypothetical protein